jgi:elongation factor P--(R)-beta-lysine ligase
MLGRVRDFFAKRGVMEVDTPMLSHTAPVDVHIEIMQVDVGFGETGYLHSSPEYGMKRLLAEGCGDIFQLSHVFRAENSGRLHNPEFMMIEWYRLGMRLEELMDETVELVRLFVDDSPLQRHTYDQLFQEVIGVDYRTCPLEELKEVMRAYHPPADFGEWDLQMSLHFLMGFVIEPTLQGLHLIRDFPKEQAALATTTGLIANRFEIYYRGIELANGFHELKDAEILRRRFNAANVERQKLGKQRLPLDEHFLAALQKGLPDSCGVAVGFDRLLMLKLGKNSLSEVLPFSWEVS